MQAMSALQDFFQRETPRMTALADQIWSLAELRYAENASAQLHIDALQQAGFRITRDVADIPTAFMAEWGDAGPVIALLGEYDALSGLNQQSGALVCTPSTDSPGLAGHGCGHHLLGTSAHFAAIALQQHLKSTGTSGRVRYYGCPAEEGGSGKTFMARAGVFDDVDAALTWHPASYTEDLLEQLNMTIYRQQQQIDLLINEVRELKRQAPEGGGAMVRNLRDELPPHY